MASYNELNALIDAYIYRNGVQAITGQILNGVLKAMVEQLGRGYTIMGAATPATDPGTPDGPECYFASEVGTYTDFDGLLVVPGELALLCYTPSGGWTKETIYEGFQTVQASIDGNVGTPSVGVSYANGVLSFDFHNMKGNPGEDGDPAGFGTIGADIAGGVGTPGVTVESSGPATAKNLQFHFTNLKGETGVTSVVATVDNTTGTPTCTASLSGGVLTLAFTGLKGAQGNTGSSVDYPFTIVNNLTTDDATQALSAAMGVQLEAEVSQLEAKVANISVVSESAGDEESVEFQTNGGDFIAKVSPDGVEAKEVMARIDGTPVSLSGTYSDANDSNQENLKIGDNSGHNIVAFDNGHIKTKYFDSRVVGTMAQEIEELKQHGSQSMSALRKNSMLEDFYSFRKGKTGNTWYNRFCLMHYSDTHVNMTNLAEALDLSNGMVDAVLDTGDNANGVASTPASTTIAELSRYEDTATPISLSCPLVICAGNHDVPNLTKKQYYDLMCGLVLDKTPGFVYGDSSHYRTYGHLDITPNATIGTIRIIVLDPFDYDDGEFMNPYGQTGVGGWMNCVFSQDQIDWLISILKGAASNGYKVITTMHYSFGDNHTWGGESANPDANYHQDPFMIPDIIDAMQNKIILSKSYPDDENINNIVINEDFSGINDFHYICHLFGHVHSENEYQCQKTDGSKFYDMLMLGAPNMGSEGYAINKVPLQPGTINSIKLTILEIDTLEHNIYRVNYGGYKAYDMSNTDRTKKISYRF